MFRWARCLKSARGRRRLCSTKSWRNTDSACRTGGLKANPKAKRLRILRSLLLFERALAGEGRRKYKGGLFLTVFLFAAVLGAGTRFGEVCVFSVLGLVDSAVNYLAIERHLLVLGWPIIFNCAFAGVGIGMLNKISHGSRSTDAGILPLVAHLAQGER